MTNQHDCQCAPCECDPCACDTTTEATTTTQTANATPQAVSSMSTTIIDAPARVEETAHGWAITAAIPGCDDASAELTLKQNVLSLRAQPPVPTAHGRLIYSEFVRGNYAWTFLLPEEADREAIEAHVKDGVIRVHVPKLAAAQSRKITINAG